MSAPRPSCAPHILARRVAADGLLASAPRPRIVAGGAPAGPPHFPSRWVAADGPMASAPRPRFVAGGAPAGLPHFPSRRVAADGSLASAPRQRIVAGGAPAGLPQFPLRGSGDVVTLGAQSSFQRDPRADEAPMPAQKRPRHDEVTAPPSEEEDILVNTLKTVLSRDSRTPAYLPIGIVAQRFQQQVRQDRNHGMEKGHRLPQQPIHDLIGMTFKQFLSKHARWFHLDTRTRGKQAMVCLLDGRPIRSPPTTDTGLKDLGLTVDMERLGGFIRPDTWMDEPIPKAGSELQLLLLHGGVEKIKLDEIVRYEDLAAGLEAFGGLYDIWMGRDVARVCFLTPAGASAALASGVVPLPPTETSIARGLASIQLEVKAATRSCLVHSLFLWHVTGMQPRAWASWVRQTFHGVRSIEWHSLPSANHAVIEFATWRSCRLAKRKIEESKIMLAGRAQSGIGDHQYCYLGIDLDVESESSPQRRSIICKLLNPSGGKVKWADADAVAAFVAEHVGHVDRTMKPHKAFVQLVLDDLAAVDLALDMLPGMCLPCGSVLECERNEGWQKSPAYTAKCLQLEATSESNMTLL